MTYLLDSAVWGKVKMAAWFGHESSTLALAKDLKWGTVWGSISTDVENAKGQSWKFFFYK